MLTQNCFAILWIHRKLCFLFSRNFFQKFRDTSELPSAIPRIFVCLRQTKTQRGRFSRREHWKMKWSLLHAIRTPAAQSATGSHSAFSLFFKKRENVWRKEKRMADCLWGNLPMPAVKQAVFLLFRQSLFFFYYGTLCVPYVPRKMHKHFPSDVKKKKRAVSRPAP